jgi:pyruvate formate-lyase/glycerol dehydratase family glycyl radical enzyme
MLTERIKAFKENHVPKHFKSEGYVKGIYLSIERSRYFTESWKETEGQPLTIRKAKALANHFRKCSIFIRPEELIVGYFAEDPSALIASLEAMSTKGVENYIEGGYVKKEEEKEWREYLDYWKDKNVENTVLCHLTEEEKALAQAQNTYIEVLPGEYTSRTQPDHDLYLDHGVKGILNILRGNLARLEAERENNSGGPELIEIQKKITDVKAMIIAAEALLEWTQRYSKLALELAEKEKDPRRREELKQIAENCAWVPANPPRTFWESMQSHWFLFIAYHCIEHPCHGTSLRLDQIFWPYFEKDVIQRKTLPRERALELMEELLIHVDEMGRPLPIHRRKALQGANYLATYTIGGVRPEDGKDACNDLTLVILDAIDELRLNHPDFKFRWHPEVNPKVYTRVLEVVRNGLGQPSIKNDPVVIDGLVDHYGFTLEEARSWAVVGCISPAPTINWGRARRDAWGTAPLKFLELALNNGIEVTAPKHLVGKQVSVASGDSRNFKGYDELFEAFRKQFAHCMKISARVKTISEYYNNELCKRPLASCFFKRSLEACRDVMDVAEKSTPWANDPSVVDTVDSLIALKKLVFEDKKYTMDEVMKALKADWNGYEPMRQEFVNAPKFGNNDPYADEIAQKTYAMIADEMSKVKDTSGVSPMPSGLVVTRMWLLADKIGAMPNGRKFGDPLADGGISPHSGYDKNGPMAAILSASKIDARKQKANIFNQKLSPSSIEGKVGLKKFENYVTTAMNLGLDMIQFNVVDGKMLKDAQKNPEQYSNLVVRVSGYNANFVELDQFVQDAVIKRTEHSLG